MCNISIPVIIIVVRHQTHNYLYHYLVFKKEHAKDLFHRVLSTGLSKTVIKSCLACANLMNSRS